jgi:hypothetical protein
MRGGIVYPLPHNAFMAWFLFKHGDNFTFTFTNFMGIKALFKLSGSEINSY